VTPYYPIKRGLSREGGFPMKVLAWISAIILGILVFVYLYFGFVDRNTPAEHAKNCFWQLMLLLPTFIFVILYLCDK
jgi:succinate dehydrogenase hydrophobic anchor subunit